MTLREILADIHTWLACEAEHRDEIQRIQRDQMMYNSP